MDEDDPVAGLDAGEKQRLFEIGAAEIRGETAEAGWTMFQQFQTPMGVRRYSNVRVLDDGRVQAREYRVDRDDPQTIFDLEMDRYLMENGIVHEVHWIVAD
ncbi:hypothetical protein AB0C65_35740 [Nocardia sp. NPDC048505]|uniref:hypothetical protein n=1 Tax=Nocardia sp. NPDC048505 TaxID=3155756 RepID=UPI0033E6E73E